MQKGDIIKEIDKLESMGIPRSSYVVIYGGALVLHGIKEDTHDLDLWRIDDEIFLQIAEMGFETERLIDAKGNHRTVVHITEHTDMNNGLLCTHIDFEEIYGINVQTIASVYLEKALRGREKDQKDIELIESQFGLKDIIAKIDARWGMKDDGITPVILDYTSSKLVNTKDFDMNASIEKMLALARSVTDTDIMMPDTKKSYDKSVPLKESEISKDKDFGGSSYDYLDWKRSLNPERW